MLINPFVKTFLEWLLRAVLAVAILLTGAHVWYLVGVSETDLESLHWEQFPNTIAVQDYYAEGRYGVLFVRLSDGAEQFIAGSWSADFADSGNAYAFGEFPHNYSSQTGEQLYLISGDNNIYDIELSTDHEIVSIQENPQANYILITLSGEKGTAFCVSEFVLQSSIECEQINFDRDGQGLWHPDEDHLAVVKNSEDDIYTLDPWNPALHNIDADTEAARYEELLELFDNAAATREPNRVGEKSFWKIANVIIARDAYDGWSMHPAPLFASIAPLSDGAHVLLKESGRLSVLELDSNSMVPVLQEDDLGDKTIELRNAGFDQSL